MKAFIIKKKYLYFFIAIVGVFCFGLLGINAYNASSPKAKYTVVIDAGHGGLDVK